MRETHATNILGDDMLDALGLRDCTVLLTSERPGGHWSGTVMRFAGDPPAWQVVGRVERTHDGDSFQPGGTTPQEWLDRGHEYDPVATAAVPGNFASGAEDAEPAADPGQLGLF